MKTFFHWLGKGGGPAPVTPPRKTNEHGLKLMMWTAVLGPQHSAMRDDMRNAAYEIDRLQAIVDECAFDSGDIAG